MGASSAAVEPAMRGAGAATRLIIASSVGNALEFYEILVYGYFAVTISKVFFRAANEAVSLLVTLGTFGISFLARPVGAIFRLWGPQRTQAGSDALYSSDDDRHRLDDGDAATVRSDCWRRFSLLPRGCCKGFLWAASLRARPPFWSNIGLT